MHIMKWFVQSYETKIQRQCMGVKRHYELAKWKSSMDKPVISLGFARSDSLEKSRF